jgi:LIVCS family branched-chain amino acid:cation transporter
MSLLLLKSFWFSLKTSQKPSNSYLVLSTGFAMFSMFFGSGNLVFPLIIGKIVDAHYAYASMGLLLTGVCVPFLGLMGIFLFHGDYEKFFDRLGPYASFIMPLMMLSLMGPFGVIPRCITVAHGSFALIVPEVTLPVFSVIFCILLFGLNADRRKIISLLGVGLTPFLLLSLGVIIGYGILYGEVNSQSSVSAGNAFLHGLLEGYQTMDLLAAFFFASVVIKYLKMRLSHEHSEQTTRKLTVLSGIVGAGILAAVYIAFVYLGAVYSVHLENINVEQFLAVIASHTLGGYAAPIVCVAVVLACLTTAVILTTVFAEFFHEKVTQKKINMPLSILLTLILSFLISTLEFKGIAAFIGPILQALYPGLILMTFLNIGYQLWGVKVIKTPVYMTFAGTSLWMIWG